MVTNDAPESAVEVPSEGTEQNIYPSPDFGLRGYELEFKVVLRFDTEDGQDSWRGECPYIAPNDLASWFECNVNGGTPRGVTATVLR